MNYGTRILICLLALAVLLGGVSLPSAETMADSCARLCYFTAGTPPPVIITIGGSGIARQTWPEFHAAPCIAEYFSGNQWLTDGAFAACVQNQADDTAVPCPLPAPLPPLSNKKVETMRN